MKIGCSKYTKDKNCIHLKNGICNYLDWCNYQITKVK